MKAIEAMRAAKGCGKTERFVNDQGDEADYVHDTFAVDNIDDCPDCARLAGTAYALAVVPKDRAEPPPDAGQHEHTAVAIHNSLFRALRAEIERGAK